MAALATALAKPLRFSVVAPDGMVVRQDDKDVRVDKEPWWTTILRSLSGMPQPAERARTALETKE